MENNDRVTLQDHYDLKTAKYWNGDFAICPVCGESMAANVCGYWSCLFGCGLQFKRDGSPMLPDGVQPSDVTYSASKLAAFKAEKERRRNPRRRAKKVSVAQS